jgi:hypothetical protein
MAKSIIFDLENILIITGDSTKVKATVFVRSDTSNFYWHVGKIVKCESSNISVTVYDGPVQKIHTLQIGKLPQNNFAYLLKLAETNELVDTYDIVVEMVKKFLEKDYKIFHPYPILLRK